MRISLLSISTFTFVKIPLMVWTIQLDNFFEIFESHQFGNMSALCQQCGRSAYGLCMQENPNPDILATLISKGKFNAREEEKKKRREEGGADSSDSEEEGRRQRGCPVS